MFLDKFVASAIILTAWTIYACFLYPFYFSPLAKVSGPKLAAITSWWIRWVDFGGHRAATIDALHRKYGKIVRIGPNELSFTGAEAMQKIYGAGSPFTKAPYFYDIFVAYGCRPLFAILDNATHASRKKLFSQMHSKSFMWSVPMESTMREKIGLWVRGIGNGAVKDVRTDTRYIAIDVISRHLWGESAEFKTLEHDGDLQLLQDIVNSQNVYLPSWLIHFPKLSEFLERTIAYVGRNPMADIRDHAQVAFQKFKAAAPRTEKIQTVGEKLWTQHISNGGDMTDYQIAAELSDLFLAGLDTTADTLSYVFWMLSKPEHAAIQGKLRLEVQGLRYEDDIPFLADTDKLPFLDSVLKETLQMFPIKAGSQPRLPPQGKATVIYGLEIPPGTVCEMQALSVNRDPEVFDNPDEFNPERWMILRDSAKFKEMNRQLWSFSSGQRMCIGQYLAMAEMQLLVATIYNKYHTKISPRTKAADMELDDQVTLSGPMSRNCWIEFETTQ